MAKKNPKTIVGLILRSWEEEPENWELLHTPRHGILGRWRSACIIARHKTDAGVQVRIAPRPRIEFPFLRVPFSMVKLWFAGRRLRKWHIRDRLGFDE
jgi:hypothetical protein